MATATRTTKKSTTTRTIEATCLVDLNDRRSAAAKAAWVERKERAARVKKLDAERAAQRKRDVARAEAGLMPYEVTERNGTAPKKWYTEVGRHVWGPDGFSTTLYRLNPKFYDRVLTPAEDTKLFEAVMATRWCPPV